MATKKNKPKKLLSQTEKAKKPVIKEASDADEKPFDFGGLPDRSLKKNLGCG
ncbi:MAG: hypothetical protein K2U26_16670 [Cyclobacteriaceae bacterium]|nr:hypothetical protein [Cyclobacteriaceae bacterium]